MGVVDFVIDFNIPLWITSDSSASQRWCFLLSFVCFLFSLFCFHCPLFLHREFCENSTCNICIYKVSIWQLCKKEQHFIPK